MCLNLTYVWLLPHGSRAEVSECSKNQQTSLLVCFSGRLISCVVCQQSLSLSLAAYLLSFFRERVTSAAPRGHYCHGDTHDALHTADFQASRPPRGWVLTLYLAGRLWWNQLCWRRKKNNKQNRAERKTRVKVSEGPALLEFAKVAQVWGTLIC